MKFRFFIIKYQMTLVKLPQIKILFFIIIKNIIIVSFINLINNILIILLNKYHQINCKYKLRINSTQYCLEILKNKNFDNNNQEIWVQHWKSKTFEGKLVQNPVNQLELPQNERKVYYQLTITDNQLSVKNYTNQTKVWDCSLKYEDIGSFIQIQNTGNLAVKNSYYEVRWQTFTGGIAQRLKFYLEQILESVVDPILFLGDAYSDIFLLIEFYTQEHYYYFTSLLVCMLLERFIQFFFIVLITSDNKKYKVIHALSTFLYLDPLLDQFVESFYIRKLKRMVRKSIECSIEALPSMFLNIHSIFYSLSIGQQVEWMQFLALGLSLLSACKSLFEIRVYVIHIQGPSQVWQKLMGPVGYELGNGSVRASFQTFCMIFIFLFSYSYSFGVYTDITRPYGVIILFGAIYGIFFISLIYFCVKYYIDVVYGRKKGFDHLLFFIWIFLIVLPIAPVFLTVGLILGGYIDWSLDYKNEYMERKILYLATLFLTPLRLCISGLFFIIYIMEENYPHNTYGFIIYIHLAYNLLYYLILMIQTKRKLPFKEICKEFFNNIKNF